METKYPNTLVSSREDKKLVYANNVYSKYYGKSIEDKVMDLDNEQYTIKNDTATNQRNIEELNNNVTNNTNDIIKAKNDINVNINNIETKYLESDADREKTFMLPIGYRDASGMYHKEITIRIPTGRVQESVAQIVRVNPAQATTAMLQLITVRLGTLEFINPDVFKKMTKKDRDFISNQLSSMEVGVKFDSEVICSSCGASFTTSIPLMSLLGE